MDYNIGDIVQLKSGGPKMTVEYIFGSNINKSIELKGKLSGINEGDLLCTWFENNKRLKDWFKKELLIVPK